MANASMITLINPPGIKTFSGFQMQTPNPPIGLAYIAAALKEEGFAYHVIDGTGEGLDVVRPYPDRSDFMVQGLPLKEIVERIPAETGVVGIGCMFSTLWPLTQRLACAVRERFPQALLVLGEGEETFVKLLHAHAAGEPFGDIPGLAFRERAANDGSSALVIKTGLSPRQRSVDTIPLPDWDSLPIEQYIKRHQINGVNLGRSMPILGTRGCPFQCTFCSNPGMWTQRWFARDPRLLVDEMALNVDKYGVTNFDFQDLNGDRQALLDCGFLPRVDRAGNERYLAIAERHSVRGVR